MLQQVNGEPEALLEYIFREARPIHVSLQRQRCAATLVPAKDTRQSTEPFAILLTMPPWDHAGVSDWITQLSRAQLAARGSGELARPVDKPTHRYHLPAGIA